jgi:hypothetical protein
MPFLPLLQGFKLAHAGCMELFAFVVVVSLLLVILGRLSLLSRKRRRQRLPTHQPKLPGTLPSRASFGALLGSYISRPEDLLRECQESAKNQKKWHTLADLVRFLRRRPGRVSSLEEQEYNWGIWRKVS